MDDGDSRSDADLLTAWRMDDRSAGALLLRRHHQSIARFFVYKVGPDSDDLVQETFLGLLEGLDRFRGEASVRTLLFAIARNQLCRHLRERIRDRRRFDPGDTSLAALDTSPSQAVVAKENERLLLRALRELPLNTQIMIELRYWEHFKLREIAQVLDVKLATVKTQLRRGRIELEQHMIRLAESGEELEASLSNFSDWVARIRRELDDDD